MQIATWNVNSIKMRAEQVVAWLVQTQTTALVMQETKTVDEAFPKALFEAAGYRVYCCGQKTYNGVAMAVRADEIVEVDDVMSNIDGYPDAQKRLIAATLTHKSKRRLRLAGAYFPNGQEVGTDKFLYKLEWISALTLWIRDELPRHDNFVLGGDFNIAPSDDDVWNPQEWKGKILVSPAERGAYASLLKTGLVDTWTLGLHAPQTYSWWDYRMSGFEKNHGLRIDHLLASPAVAGAVSEVWIDAAPRALEKPSDHAPVVMRLDWK